MRIALTGGTGFVGSHVVDAALAAGHQISALTRREQEPRDGLRWVMGSLEDRESLRATVEDADAVVHVAGVINAPNEAGFRKGNAEGTLSVLAAATAAGVTRFVHVSSLAAREPHLSLYGRSKKEAEELVESSGLQWTIVRPPAVYGPGDRETLDLFKMAARGHIFMPPSGRLSLIHVGDLARLLLACAGPDAPSKLLIEPDDGQPGGWTHRQFGEALGEAVGRRPRVFSTPRPLLSLASRFDRAIRGDRAKLTPDRAAYFSHSDWVCSSDRPVPEGLWWPQVETRQGLKQTAEWYRSSGWL